MDEQPKIAEPKSKPRRRWYQFSLRTLLIAVTLAGCGFAWVGVKIREARQQQAVVALIERKGGFVRYDYQFGGSYRLLVRAAVPPGPAWLRAMVGDDCFRHVFEAAFGGGSHPTFSDADFKELEVLSQLNSLCLANTGVTNAGLAHLRNMTQLKSLWLNGTAVSDGGLETLKGLRQLKELRLDETSVTNAGLKFVGPLTQLEFLNLQNTKVTDEGVARLQTALPKCVIRH